MFETEEKKGKGKYLKPVILGCLVLSLVIGGFITRSRGSREDIWNRDRLAPSMTAYCESAISRAIRAWENFYDTYSPIDEDGRMIGDDDVYLLVDTNSKVVKVEKNGVSFPEYSVDLPKNLNWRLDYADLNGLRKLTGPVRLKVRGKYTSNIFPEKFFLIGEHPHGGYIAFQFGYRYLGMSGGSGAFQVGSVGLKDNSTNVDPAKRYGSVLVGADEYKAFLDKQAELQEIPNEVGNDVEGFPDLNSNLRNWSAVEKYLCMEIEQRISKMDLRLLRMEIKPGPGYQAAHAKFSVEDTGILRYFIGSHSATLHCLLNIDYLGESAWYVRSTMNQKRPFETDSDLEFVVTPEENLSRREYQRLLTLAREEISSSPSQAAQSQWRARLPNDTIIEFIGLCESPSLGKKWWGPDGSPIDTVPYYTDAATWALDKERNPFEVAWRCIASPSAQMTGHNLSSSMEGSVGSSSHSVCDRYGYDLYDIEGSAYLFDKDRTTATLKVGVTSGNWKDVAAFNIQGELIGGTPQTHFKNLKIKQESDKVVLSVVYTENRYDASRALRWVLIDNTGKVTTPRSEDITEKIAYWQEDHEFEEVGLANIARIVIQERRYEFAVFRNISLVPGKNQGFEIIVDQKQIKADMQNQQ